MEVVVKPIPGDDLFSPGRSGRGCVPRFLGWQELGLAMTNQGTCRSLAMSQTACRSHTCTAGGCGGCFVSRRILQSEHAGAPQVLGPAQPRASVSGCRDGAAALQPREGRSRTNAWLQRSPHVREAPQDRAQLLPFAGATLVSCHGCFPECSVCPASWGWARCRHSGGAPRARPPRGAPGAAGPVLHKRRSAADAAGGLQGESQLLGTGGREGSRLLRAGGAPRSRPAPARWLPAVVPGSAARERGVRGPRGGSSGARAPPAAAALRPEVSAGAIEFSFPKMFLHNYPGPILT